MEAASIEVNGQRLGLVNLCGGLTYMLCPTDESGGPPYSFLVIGVDPTTNEKKISQGVSLELGDEVKLQLFEAEDWELSAENGLFE
jgi:hypothetical protein